MTKSKKSYIWVGTSNPYNSIYIQSQMLIKAFSEVFNVETILLHPEIENVKEMIKNIVLSKDTLIWQYGGFDKYLLGIDTKSIIFVYHNITPAKYFWRYDPVVSIRSLIGSLQMLIINRKCNWVTMSKYNLIELYGYGFKSVNVCPNIVTIGNVTKIEKTKQISLLYVGRISPNKNCIDLLYQVELLANKLATHIELTIVGSVKVGCMYGKKFIKKYNKLLSHPFLKICWKKELYDFELKELYEKSWLYVSMSLHEGFGVPVCESVANGTPAIYLMCGGQESILNNYGMVKLIQKDQYSDYLLYMILNVQARNQLLLKQQEAVSRYIMPEVNKIIYETYKNVFNNNQDKSLAEFS